ncbi:Zinc-finger domain containing protein [Parasponia andersonii]|uniref:Zinc-finger domain containing protein n=1 Tax=Parasponia andersonii TaxID=3476 RepID=A0A2P5DY25_PARAD|nr:Zinc-finger domain containing protein [Parasponia andersonii]
MAVASSSASKTKVSSKESKDTQKMDQAPQAKRRKSSGVRVVGGRIYDSENGKTCHQCRQKTMDFVASCKNQKGNKLCTLNVCHKCLLNRYGEKAEEVALLDDWTCPKCRGICNCSFCMKKRGHKPTGILVHAAKAIGFSSASEMIKVRGPENLDVDKNVKRSVDSPKKTVTSTKESVSRVASPMKRGKENSFDEIVDSNANPSNSTPISGEKRSKKAKREGLKEISNGDKVAADCSIQSSTKGAKVSTKKSEKKMKVTGEDDCVPVEKKSSKKRVSDEFSLHPIKPEDDNNKIDGEKAQYKMSEKKMKKTVKDGCVPLEKKSHKKRVSDEASLHSIKTEDDRNKNDDGKNKMSDKKMKTIGNVGCAPLKKKSSKKMISGEVSLHPIKPEDDRNKNDGAEGQDKMSKKKKTAGKDVCVPLEEKSSKKKDLDEVSLHPIKPDDEIKNKDGGEGQDAGVLNVSIDVDAKAKKRKAKALDQSHEIKKCATSLEQTEVSVPLPQGTILTTVWGIELSPEDIGHALQFLEFCASFGKVLDIRKGQAEAVLRELKRGSSCRRGQYSSVVRFHTQLLSLMQEDMGEESHSVSSKNSWLQALEKCISESECVSEELSSANFGKRVEGYDSLDFSKKLRILNFLCDEALGTTKLRSWIDDENSKLVEREKESKEKVVAAKSKEKLLKQKMQDEIAKAILAKNGAPLSISEHEAIVSQIKIDVAQAHSEILKAMGSVTKRRRRSDAVRTEPNFLDAEGHVFWKLRCCGGELDMLLQDIGTSDVDAFAEKWFLYGPEQKEEIEKYISSIRGKWMRNQRYAHFLTSQSKTKDTN